MSHGQSTKYLTEIQTLSLLPNHKIGSWSSQCREALQIGLRTTASHPKCDGIYWLQKKEDPQQIVIISEWKEAVDFTTSRSYLRPLLLYLESPPARSTHVNHASHSFSSHSITNFVTSYFPIRKCSYSFKAQISANVGSFINATERTYTNSDSLRFVASGWIKETKMVGGEVANGFMFCLMWTDRKSAERYKSENEHWRVLMRYLKGMGMLDEEQFHGKAYQVLGEGQRERFEFSDDSRDDDDGIDEEVEPMRAQLKRLMLAQDEEVLLAKNTSYWRSGEADADVTRIRNGIELLRSPKSPKGATKEGPCITSWWEEEPKQTAEDDSDAESSIPSTPLLTPSSSTMSLTSLFEEPKSLNELPGTWKSEYDISQPQDERNENASLPEPHNIPANGTPASFWFPVCQLRRMSFGDDEEASHNTENPEMTAGVETGADLSSNDIPQIDPSVTSQLRDLFSDNPRRSSTSSDESALRKYGTPKWNADEELQNAKSRFWRRRERFVTPRLETQRATLRGRSPPPPHLANRRLPIEHDLTIDPLRNNEPDDKRRNSWWAYLRECLPNPAAGSMASKDVEAGGDVDSMDVEGESVSDKSVASSGYHASICTLNGPDRPLSVREMEQAKARLAGIR